MGCGLDPKWMMRNQSSRIRFESDYVYELDDGVRLAFEQGGNGKDVGQTAWDGGIVLGKYIEHAVRTGGLVMEGKTKKKGRDE